MAYRPGGGGVLGLIFAGYVPLASQSSYPIMVYSVANYRPHLSHFCTLNEEHVTFHLRYKHSGMFANRKYEELSYPQKSGYLVTLLKMRP